MLVVLGCVNGGGYGDDKSWECEWMYFENVGDLAVMVEVAIIIGRTWRGW